MLAFGFGFVSGFSVSILIILVLIYFRHPVERKVSAMERAVDLLVKKPRGKGYLFEAQTDAEVARQAIIDRNTAAGRDTKLSELL